MSGNNCALNGSCSEVPQTTLVPDVQSTGTRTALQHNDEGVDLLGHGSFGQTGARLTCRFDFEVCVWILASVSDHHTYRPDFAWNKSNLNLETILSIRRSMVKTWLHLKHYVFNRNLIHMDCIKYWISGHLAWWWPGSKWSQAITRQNIFWSDKEKLLSSAEANYNNPKYNMLDMKHIDGLVQERRNSSALALELRLSCMNPSTWNIRTI